MQCLQLTRGDAPSTGVTVELSGTFDSTYAYVTIGGKTYTSAQTLTVEKGTEVAVAVYDSTSSKSHATITLNGSSVSSITTSGLITYSFTVTDNCKIVSAVQQNGVRKYGTIAITMPA